MTKPLLSPGHNLNYYSFVNGWRWLGNIESDKMTRLRWRRLIDDWQVWWLGGYCQLGPFYNITPLWTDNDDYPKSKVTNWQDYDEGDFLMTEKCNGSAAIVNWAKLLHLYGRVNMTRQYWTWHIDDWEVWWWLSGEPHLGTPLLPWVAWWWQLRYGWESTPRHGTHSTLIIHGAYLPWIRGGGGGGESE